VYTLSTQLNASDSWIVRALLKLRGIPSHTSTGIEGWKKMGFAVLEQQENKEIILGLIGQFWKASGKVQPCTPNEFHSFKNPAFAKAVWNFEITPSNQNQVLLETETRILCGSEEARKQFARYWFFIRPFSGLIRKEILRIVKRKAES